MRVMKWVIGAVGTASVGAFSGATYLFKKTIKRANNTQVSQIPSDLVDIWQQHIPTIQEEIKWLKQQARSEIYVRTKDGLRLRGIWLKAPIQTNKVILTLHGYRSKGESDFAAISHFYHDKGYHVLIVDHRAHGKSEGEYIGFGVLDHQDCKAWITKIIEKLGKEAQIYIHGISMGGATAIALCSEKLPPQVKGIIADCAFTSPWEVFEHVLRTDYHLPAFPTLYIADAICRDKAGYAFDGIRNTERVEKAKLPILFIHGDRDNFVPTWMSKEMYRACTSKKKMLLVKGAGHGESYYKDTKNYQETVETFLREIDL